MGDYAHPDALVTTDWVDEHRDDPDVVVAEVNVDTQLYDTGHISGAHGWSWKSQLSDVVRRDILSKDDFEKLMRSAGIRKDDTVVLYGDSNNWFAAWAFWQMKIYGHQDVRIMDGGRKKWELEELPLTDDIPRVSPTDFRIQEGERTELRALRDDVLDRIGTAAFIDVRSPEEFSGEKLAPEHLPQEQPYVGGHIPGARNIPWSQAAREDGTFRNAEELRDLYGEPGDDEIITYCRIGERSSHTWFVLKELLGYEDVRNYDGSWTEYGSLVGAPVERGREV